MNDDAVHAPTAGGPGTPGPASPDAPSCALCGDVATPARIVAVHGDTAVVEDAGGCRRTVAIDFVPGAATGDRVIVHLDVAIGRMEEPACDTSTSSATPS